MRTRIFFISISIAATITIASCGKDFLEVPVQGQSLPENDPDFAANLVTGAYNSLINTDGWGRDIHGLMFVIATNIRSDDADKGSSPGDFGPAGEIDNFTLSPGNSVVNSIWKGHYNAINVTNRALENLPDAAVDDATRSRLTAEVRFIRGYLYFNLIRYFGNIPLITRVPTDNIDANSDEFTTQVPKADIYNFIIEDLTFAKDNLPLKGQTQVGRATKGAALALLAKVYMYTEPADWQKVYDLTREVMDSGLYGLVEDYSEIWREVGKNNNESIFEIQTGETAACNGGIYNYAEFQGPRAGFARGWSDLGWGFGGPSQDLVNAYEAGDKRKDATVITIDNDGTTLWDGVRIPSKDSVENQYYNYKAYHSQQRETYCGDRGRMPKNVRILRYADVLLMNAEASYNLNKADEALGIINDIRDRAGLDPLGFVTIEAIWKERRLELALEHDRFFDLVRQGRAGQVMRAAGKVFVDGKHELLPIPQEQIDLSANKLEQNPNY